MLIIKFTKGVNMNVGKSLKIALVKCEKNQTWLAEKLGMSRQGINNIANADGGNVKTNTVFNKGFRKA